MDNRLSTLRKYLNSNSLDSVIISAPEHIIYYSDFTGFSSLERDGYLLITKSSGYILTSPLYAEAVKEQVKHLKLLTITDTSPLLKHLERIKEKDLIKRIGFEVEDLRVSEWKKIGSNFVNFIPVDISMLRVRKSDAEIEFITVACAIADAAFQKSKKKLQPGMSELEFVFLLENEIRKKGSDVAFPSIVAFGKNAAIPHHKSDTTKLRSNDTILIDFGAVSQEYRSDITRTLFTGKISKEQKKAYLAVLEAQKAAVTFIKSSLSSREKVVKASAVDKVARDYLLSQSYPSIPHSLGHGIGLAVHEFPRLSPNSPDTLDEGMVFTIEPGVYFPGNFGVRIEDLYVIKKGTLRQLSFSPYLLSSI
jgi:Xaa-Pro aminopeptidase